MSCQREKAEPRDERKELEGDRLLGDALSPVRSSSIPGSAPCCLWISRLIATSLYSWYRITDTEKREDEEMCTYKYHKPFLRLLKVTLTTRQKAWQAFGTSKWGVCILINWIFCHTVQIRIQNNLLNDIILVYGWDTQKKDGWGGGSPELRASPVLWQSAVSRGQWWCRSHRAVWHAVTWARWKALPDVGFVYKQRNWLRGWVTSKCQNDNPRKSVWPKGNWHKASPLY